MHERLQIAETVRQTCIEIAIQAYEDAGLGGLCPEGRWEYAVDAIRGLDLRPLLAGPGPAQANRRMKDSN